MTFALKKFHLIKALAGILGLAILSGSAQAGIVTIFSDKATFLGTAGAASITGPIPDVGNVGTTETLGDVTFSTTAFSTTTDIFFGGENWSTLIPDNEIALSGTENLAVSINLGFNVTSFGFDFHEPSSPRTAENDTVTDTTNTPNFFDSLFTIELYDGVTLIDSTRFDPDNDQLLFFGLTSDMGFDNVRIIEDLAGETYNVNGNDIDISNDNEFFGEFYAAPVDVPEPSTLLLLGTGLIAFSARRFIK